MADKSAIEWTDATWPIVQGCDYESPGCANCYAVPLLWRMAHNPNQAISGPLQGVVAKNAAGKLHFTGKVALREDRLEWPLKWKEPRQIFVPSHGDLFHPSAPDWFIDKVFAVMALCPQHTFQVLTKRAARMRAYFEGRVAVRIARINDGQIFTWPLRHVWLGVSTEDQARADERIPHLLATPAAKRFISAEPLLGRISLEEAWHGANALDSECWGDCAWCEHGHPPLHNCQRGKGDWEKGRSGLDWVIAGGESGPRARLTHPDWVRGLRDQCQAAEVPFFFKQWGEHGPYRPDEPQHDAFHLRVDGRVFGAPQVSSTPMVRYGKKRAGATLDGRVWRDFPTRSLVKDEFGAAPSSASLLPP